MSALLSRLVPVIVAAVLLFGSVLAMSSLMEYPSEHSTAVASFSIRGTLDVPLHPGSRGVLNLTLTNPSRQDMSVTALSTAVTNVQSADPALPCTVEDFAVDQFTGSFPIALAGSGAKTLSELGIPTRRMPILRMLDTATNQDGCQGATVTLGYTGTAEEPG